MFAMLPTPGNSTGPYTLTVDHLAQPRQGKQASKRKRA